MIFARVLVCACVLGFAANLLGQDLLVRGGRVIPMEGKEIPAGSVLIQGGLIEAVGAELQAPRDVRVLSAEGRVIMPGFVLAHSSDGLERPNERVRITPYVSVLDSIDPSSGFFENSLRDGHLTISVMPGDATAVGGMGRILRPVGLTVEDMTVVADGGLKISLVPPTGNRAAHLAEIRNALDDAKRHLEQKKAEKEIEPSGNLLLDLEALTADRRKVALLRLLSKELPAYVSCGTGGDVYQALKLAKDYGLDVRLVLGPGTWRAADYLAKHKVPVILGPTLEIRETDPDTGKTSTHVLPKILHDASVPFCVTSAPSSLGRRYLWYQAACLVRYGVPREQALAAVTKRAAEALGLGSRKGSLAKGKDGDLLVLTDDPLSGKAWVETAVVGGRIVYERSADPRLSEVFGR